jgi:hypothetical protein
MAIVTMILGKSGTGKSTSLRNMKPQTVSLIQLLKKPLPFKAGSWKPFVNDNYSTVIAAMRKAAGNGSKIIILDDFQYMMANEFMRRTDEKGFEKFTEIGRHVWDVLMAAGSLPDDVRVYVLSHTEEDDYGGAKMKTIGKMLDEKIALEGMVTIVLRTHVSDGVYQFATQNNGADTTKSPLGMFDSKLIDNDLAAVDSAICEYYNINKETEQAA